MAEGLLELTNANFDATVASGFATARQRILLRAVMTAIAVANCANPATRELLPGIASGEIRSVGVISGGSFSMAACVDVCDTPMPPMTRPPPDNRAK